MKTIALLLSVALLSTVVLAEQVAVRHPEKALVHGFLALRTQNGTTVADGEYTPAREKLVVDAGFVFHFKDGSL